MKKPLVDKKYVLEKFPGKGGWTFARIPEVLQDKTSHFGWVKVKGSIDGFEIKNYNLMPMGDKRLFLPVKAEIRKKIKKQEGDYIHVILFTDNDPLEIPAELMLCLKEEPVALKFFKTLSEGEQKLYIQWIYSAKKVDTKIERLAKSINKLVKGEKFTQS
ncbi:MAG TPA: YdeI/OmpD-associated family protein [Bacteroidia bacterium]|nr:YdeI/OmpD-associated family protein [Bacteroidia bacterium]